MNLPGFAAELSLYQRSASYRMFAAAHAGGEAVVPQFPCGACECDQNECCYYTPGPGGDCACIGRNSKGACPQLGRLRDDRFTPFFGDASARFGNS